MGKPKQSTKLQKKSKAKATPETASEFQEAADFEEDTGGKWRAGDPAKSARAFIRACDGYDASLQRFPSNFDLAYNRARLQLEITQQPSLIAHFPLPLLELLQQTLESHRYALRLKEDNADALFNTSQVLTSLAEHLSEQSDCASAVPLLEEALELLSSCLSRQELLYEQQQADFGDVDEDGGGGVPLEAGEQLADTTGSSASEQSAVIETLLTPSDLLDTVYTSLSALSTLISISPSSNLQTLGDMAYILTAKRAPMYISQLLPNEQTAARSMLALERAQFIAAYASAEYEAGSIDADTYLDRLSSFNDASIHRDQAVLCAQAEALTDFATSPLTWKADRQGRLPYQQCWTQLTQANDLYAHAIKLSARDPAEQQGKIYLARGDVEMLRFRISTAAAADISAAFKKAAPTLSKNAQTYYQGARGFFGAAHDAKGAGGARARAEIAVMAQKAVGHVVDVEETVPTDVLFATAQEMVEEGLLDRELVHRLLGVSVDG